MSSFHTLFSIRFLWGFFCCCCLIEIFSKDTRTVLDIYNANFPPTSTLVKFLHPLFCGLLEAIKLILSLEKYFPLKDSNSIVFCSVSLGLHWVFVYRNLVSVWIFLDGQVGSQPLPPPSLEMAVQCSSVTNWQIHYSLSNLKYFFYHTWNSYIYSQIVCPINRTIIHKLVLNCLNYSRFTICFNIWWGHFPLPLIFFQNFPRYSYIYI